MKDFKHKRPTIGVLAGWQFYEGGPHGHLVSVFQGIQAMARARDCNLLLACGVGQGDGRIFPAWPVLAPDSHFVPVGPWNTDGLIVILPLLSAARSCYIQQVIAAGHPVAFVGAGENGSAVTVDNETGIRELLKHLIGHGHQQIAYIAGFEENEGDAGQRLRAYQAVVRECGLADDPALIAYGHDNVGNGRQAMEQILASGVKFTAVLANNDESAIGALETLAARGLRVPQDIVVVGFDDRFDARAQTPPLTTACYPTFETGMKAMELLLKQLEGNANGAEIVRLPSRLVIRQSCGCQPGKVAADEEGVEGLSSLARKMSEPVLTEMWRANADEVQEMCQHLLDAFVQSLEQGDAIYFLSVLRHIVSYTEEVDEVPHIWQAVISVLQHEMSALLKGRRRPGLRRQADEMLHQARIVISESMQRKYIRYVTDRILIDDQMGWLNSRLLMARDESQIFHILVEHLTALGLEDVRAALFEPEGNDLVAWSDLCRGVGPEPASRRFPSREFPPAGLYPADKPFQLALLPLLIREDEAAGYMVFDADHVGLCASIVRSLAAALRSNRLFRKIRQRTIELEVLADFSSALRQASTLTEMLPLLVEKAMELLHADAGTLILQNNFAVSWAEVSGKADKVDEMFIVAMGRGAPQTLIGRRYLPGDDPMWQVIRSGETLFVGDVAERVEFGQSEIYRTLMAGLTSFVCAPLRTPGTVEANIGLLHLAYRSCRQTTEEEKHLLAAIAELAGNAIQRAGLHDEIVEQAERLRKLLVEQRETYDVTLATLSAALDLRDKTTEGHSLRVTQLAVTIAQAMDLPVSEVEALRRGALLHDIGKIGVPDHILLKQGAFSGEEWVEMHRHAQFGWDMLKDIKFLAPVLPVVLSHHERWDGNGYPHGLRGDAIPFSARIFAVADAYDAMISDRPYRQAMSPAEAMAEIQREAGKQFDPRVVRTFLSLMQQGKVYSLTDNLSS